MDDGLAIGVRFALYLTLATLFGLAALSLYGLRDGGRHDTLALRPWLVTSSGLALMFSVAWLVLTAAGLAGTPVWPIDRAAVEALLAQSAGGTAWQVRMVALAVAAAAAIRASDRFGLASVASCGALALAILAWTGHGAMDDGAIGWFHFAADIAHLLAAGVWVGALLGLILLVSRPASRVDAAHLGAAHRALHEFTTVGTIVVATLVATGVANIWLLVGIGNLTTLGATLYGQILFAKLALFAAMLGLAALNRFRLTPAFESSIAAADHRAALAALRFSLVIEMTAVITILALVAWLGTLAPPGSGA